MKILLGALVWIWILVPAAHLIWDIVRAYRTRGSVASKSHDWWEAFHTRERARGERMEARQEELLRKVDLILNQAPPTPDGKSDAGDFQQPVQAG